MKNGHINKRRCKYIFPTWSIWDTVSTCNVSSSVPSSPQQPEDVFALGLLGVSLFAGKEMSSWSVTRQTTRYRAYAKRSLNDIGPLEISHGNLPTILNAFGVGELFFSLFKNIDTCLNKQVYWNSLRAKSFRICGNIRFPCYEN